MLQSLVYTNTHTQCQLGGVRERSYGEEQEFSPTDICILVRFDTPPSTGPVVVEGVGEGVRERKEKGRQRRQWEERQESEEIACYLVPSTSPI